jgi:hypothetical protein
MYAEVSRLKCTGALARLAFINVYRNRNHSDRDKLPNSDNRHYPRFRVVGVPAAGGISQTSSGVYERGHWSPEGQGTFSQFGSVTRGSRPDRSAAGFDIPGEARLREVWRALSERAAGAMGRFGGHPDGS